MKTKIKYLLCITILNVVTVCPIQAKEEALHLNTETLKNKQNEYSSLTDINGVNLFTSDMQQSMQKQDRQEKQQYDNSKKILFTKQIKEVETTEIPIFTKPITFDKTLQSEEVTLPVNLILCIFTAALGSFVFAVTRKYYKQKEEKDNEVDDNIYQ